MIPAEFMKELGRTTRGKAGATSYSPMATLTKVSIWLVKQMAKEHMFGEMVKCMTVNGTTDRKKATESGKAYMETAISASGLIAKPKATGSMCG